MDYPKVRCKDKGLTSPPNKDTEAGAVRKLSIERKIGKGSRANSNASASSSRVGTPRRTRSMTKAIEKASETWQTGGDPQTPVRGPSKQCDWEDNERLNSGEYCLQSPLEAKSIVSRSEGQQSAPSTPPTRTPSSRKRSMSRKLKESLESGPELGDVGSSPRSKSQSLRRRVSSGRLRQARLSNSGDPASHPKLPEQLDSLPKEEVNALDLNNEPIASQQDHDHEDFTCDGPKVMDMRDAPTEPRKPMLDSNCTIDNHAKTDTCPKLETIDLPIAILSETRIGSSPLADGTREAETNSIEVFPSATPTSDTEHSRGPQEEEQKTVLGLGKYSGGFVDDDFVLHPNDKFELTSILVPTSKLAESNNGKEASTEKFENEYPGIEKLTESKSTNESEAINIESAKQEIATAVKDPIRNSDPGCSDVGLAGPVESRAELDKEPTGPNENSSRPIEPVEGTITPPSFSNVPQEPVHNDVIADRCDSRSYSLQGSIMASYHDEPKNSKIPDSPDSTSTVVHHPLTVSDRCSELNKKDRQVPKLKTVNVTNNPFYVPTMGARSDMTDRRRNHSSGNNQGQKGLQQADLELHDALTNFGASYMTQYRTPAPSLDMKSVDWDAMSGISFTGSRAMIDTQSQHYPSYSYPVLDPRDHRAVNHYEGCVPLGDDPYRAEQIPAKSFSSSSKYSSGVKKEESDEFHDENQPPFLFDPNKVEDFNGGDPSKKRGGGTKGRTWNRQEYSDRDRQQFFDLWLSTVPRNAKAAAEALGIRYTTASNWIKQFRDNGQEEIPMGGILGRPYANPLTEEHETHIISFYKRITQEKRAMKLDELLDELTTQFEDLKLSKTGLRKHLNDMNFKYQRLSKHAENRNSPATIAYRQKWIDYLDQSGANYTRNCVFIDEAGFDENMKDNFGWAFKGSHPVVDIKNNAPAFTLFGAISHEGIVDVQVKYPKNSKAWHECVMQWEHHINTDKPNDPEPGCAEENAGSSQKSPSKASKGRPPRNTKASRARAADKAKRMTMAGNKELDTSLPGSSKDHFMYFLWSLMDRLRHNSTFNQRCFFILDNARIHKGGEITDMIKMANQKYDTGFEVLYLPPYSPELNPIENIWSMMKRNFADTRRSKLVDRLACSQNGITPEIVAKTVKHATKYFDHCRQGIPLKNLH
ncbi:hypothetical protein KL916_005436 [Ogataea parapolymorpha]|nr:hypothetical protein KL916_005436 [Ogataea parapolymorpha]